MSQNSFKLTAAHFTLNIFLIRPNVMLDKHSHTVSHTPNFKHESQCNNLMAYSGGYFG